MKFDHIKAVSTELLQLVELHQKMRNDSIRITLQETRSNRKRGDKESFKTENTYINTTVNILNSQMIQYLEVQIARTSKTMSRALNCNENDEADTVDPWNKSEDEDDEYEDEDEDEDEDENEAYIRMSRKVRRRQTQKTS